MKFRHATLFVKDMEESLRFYRDVVGLPVRRRYPAGPSMELAFLGEGETEVELIRDAGRSSVDFGSDISLGFEVDSADDAMSRLKGLGITIHSGPFQPNPATRFFYVLDPNGLKIQFIQR
jgi:lactoylglutathione lyase